MIAEFGGALGVVATSQRSVAGPGRASNQDFVGRWAPDRPDERARYGSLFIVADGVGTDAGGATASRVAVEAAIRAYREGFDGLPDQALRRAIEAANQAVFNRAADDPDLRGMATTCTAAVVFGNRLYVSHVGDSRAYLVRGGRARQLTVDHTWVAQQAPNVPLSQDIASTSALRHAVTRLLGAESEIDVDSTTEPLHDGDAVVLCTDGLSEVVDEAAIAAAVRTEDPRGAAEALLERARAGGSTDDISVIVLFVEPVVGPAPPSVASAVEARSADQVEAPPPALQLRRPVILLGTLVCASILAVVGLLNLYHWAYRDRIVPGVRALGLDLGGRTPGEATVVLDERFIEYARQPLTLEVAGDLWFLTPAELGARLDASATAAAAFDVGHGGSLIEQMLEQMRAFVRGRSVPLVYQVDQGRLEATLEPIARRVESASGGPQDASLLVDPTGAVRVVPGRSGRTLDIGQGVERLRERLAALGAGELRLPVAPVPPALTEAELAEPRATLERVLGEPLTVQAGSETIELRRQDLATMISVRKEQVSGRPRVSIHLLDVETDRVLRPLAQRAARPPRHARFEWVNGSLSVLEPGVDGQELDLGQAARILEEQTLAGARTVSLPLRSLPALGEADRERLEIRDLVAEAAVRLGASPDWWRGNVERTAARIHGLLVLPGQTFSFLGAVGPPRQTDGFQFPPGGDPVPPVESGVTLVSSALFQALFPSGYAIEERYAHERWLTRLASPSNSLPGLDALVDPALGRDLRFTNTTAQPLLIQASGQDEQLVVRLYSTRPQWTVHMAEAQVSDRVAPGGEPERRMDSTLPGGQELWLEEPSDGFVVTITRTVQTPGESRPRVLELVSRYRPNRGLQLAGPPSSGGR